MTERKASTEIRREAEEEPEGELGYQATTEGALGAATNVSVPQKPEMLEVQEAR